MNTILAPVNPSYSIPTSLPLSDSQSNWRSYPTFVSWPAIFAGMATAIALQVLFMLLGAGLGFALYTPLSDTNPVADLSRGTMVVQGLSAVFSLWFGGWVAGRLAPGEPHSSGSLHGFIVWCSATVAAVLIVSAGAGWAMGDLSKLVGGGLSLAGRPVAALTGAAGTSMDRSPGSAPSQARDTLASFTDEALGNRPSDAPRGQTIRAKREVGLAVARLFSPVQVGDPGENRAAAVKALQDDAGMSPADAEAMVAQWTASYDRVKADLAAAKTAAENKARAAADEASKALAVFSLCTFLAFVLGALAASWGGYHGAISFHKHEGWVATRPPGSQVRSN